MSTPHDPTQSFSPLDGVIAAYLQSVEAGQVPNRQEFLDRHPELTEDLRAFFADLDRMDRVAAPLRPDDGIDATTDGGDEAPSLPASVRYFGDYELLEEVAHGGMGVVYKARQVSLNRLVALKMILRGAFAIDRDIARFRAEAESAASLDHPHIVPIYEVGEEAGQQYYSMKFVDGTSLAGLARGDMRAEVMSLLDIARAVHYAHQRGILHRDLKPSNVLVDSGGVRYVTDFGLAKRLTDTNRSLTQSGDMVGTPRYMAPEQAAGRKDLTIAADVYSLGVILYERLTGRAPFMADDLLTLLRQVRETEPARPSSLVSGMDRDLETVVLKCLEKEPGRRYASAEALAEDLSHWLAGRPVAARPVGQGERFWRWCKRNPVVSGLTAAVGASLLIGTVVSTFFGMRANARAKAERLERLRAEAAESATERMLARSLVRPFNPEGDLKSDNGHRPLVSDPESVALWELAGVQDHPVALRFLDENTRDPLLLRQLFARSEPALIALLGLSPDRRMRASKRLSERLVDPALSLTMRAEVAFLVLEIEDRPSAATDEAAAILSRAFAANVPPHVRNAWRQHLEHHTGRFEPLAAAGAVVSAMEWEKNGLALDSLSLSLSSLASRLEPAEATKLCGRAAGLVVSAIEREKDADALGSLSSALSSLASRLEPTDAVKLCGRATSVVVSAMEREKDADALSSLSSGLSSLSSWLKSSDAATLCGRAASVVVSAMEREKDADALSRQSSGLSSFATRLEPSDAAKLVKRLLSVIARLPSFVGHLKEHVLLPGERQEDARLRALRSEMLRRYQDRVKMQIGTSTRPFYMSAKERELDERAVALLSGFASLASQLEVADAAKLCGAAASAVVLTMQGEKDGPILDLLSSTLASLAARLDPDDAASLYGRAANSMVSSMEGRTTGKVLYCRPAFPRCRLG